MTMTPSGSLTPYCNAAECLTFVDWRLVGDLCSDDDTRVPLADLKGTAPTYGDADVNLYAALLAASGELEASCLVGRRYAPSDLSALTGASAQYLKKIVAYLALGGLRHRRGIFDDSEHPQVKEAREAVQKLEDGNDIFSFAETAQAGLPKSVFRNFDDDRRLNLMSSIARRVFGTRSNQYPRY